MIEEQEIWVGGTSNQLLWVNETIFPLQKGRLSNTKIIIGQVSMFQ